MKAVLAGATGFIGRQIVRRMRSAGHQVVVLTRRPTTSLNDGVTAVSWDGRMMGDWIRSIDQSDIIVNLTGESLAAKRWTEEQKQILELSRVESTRILVEAMGKMTSKPAALINASAVGYYGSVPEGDVDESHPASKDFLGRLCEKWESEAMKATEYGVRAVCIRLGIVLGRQGGALEKVIPPFKMYIGGHFGTGAQWFSWIHEEDVVASIFHIIETPSLSGPVNLTAPNPVRNKEFCRILGTVIGRPSWLRVSSFALNLVLGEFAQSLLGGQRVIPKKLTESGYSFKYEDLKEALQDILVNTRG